MRIVGGLVGGGTLCWSLEGLQRANPTVWGFSPQNSCNNFLFIIWIISTAEKYSEWSFRQPCLDFCLCNQLGGDIGGGGGDSGKAGDDGGDSGIKAGPFTRCVSKSHQSWHFHEFEWQVTRCVFEKRKRLPCAGREGRLRPQKLLLLDRPQSKVTMTPLEQNPPEKKEVDWSLTMRRWGQIKIIHC